MTAYHFDEFMKINNVYCLFEQSGTFRDAFRSLGYHAIDIDIDNQFETTDIVTDIFAEIDNCCNGQQSIFDQMTASDLIFAFFPCTYFSCMSQAAFCNTSKLYAKLSDADICDKIIERESNRSLYYIKLLRLIKIVYLRNLRLIIENPATMPHYLLFPQNFIKKPDIIDHNRSRLGDYFKKPTAYWFFNCSRTFGQIDVTAHHVKTILGTHGIERSLISQEYAVNFIRTNILGQSDSMQMSLF